MLQVKTEDINKYERAVLGSKEAALLLGSSLKEAAHCMILQSEDRLFLDLLSFIYIRDKLAEQALTMGDLSTSKDNIALRILSDSIPDLMVLPSGERVLTEDVERIVETAYLSPTEFETKIYLIDRAETMNDSAQNKLLKLLEEPPPSCRFILKCTSKQALLPTVRSRSRLIDLQPLSDEAVLASLPSQLDGARRDLIAATCFGRLDYCECVLKDDTFLAIESACFEIFRELRSSADLLKSSYLLLQFKDNLETVIFYIECILHDCMVYSLGERSRISFKHKEKEISQYAKEYASEVVLQLTEPIKRARLRLSTYGNATGIVDELLFSMLEVKTKWQRL